ncbi:hypothetical protein [Thalassobacillus hwangdonensis]|uniref:Carboxypeptidase regulatory-like domain-containing protein n=1 Tax=Thalassobacillus hwangdonensis TaxID=546108 RepID=A0ABW3L056_9BACI
MKISMKVKHLVYTALGVLFASLLISQYILPTYSEAGDRQKEVSSAEGILKKLESSMLSDKKRNDLIMDQLSIRSVDYNTYDLYIGPSMTHQSAVTDGIEKVPFEQMLPHVRGYLEKNRNATYETAVKWIAIHYRNQGKLEKAVKEVDRYADQLTMKGNEYWSLQLFKAELLSAESPEASLEALNEYKQGIRKVPDSYLALESVRLEVRMLLAEKRYEEALGLIEEWSPKANSENVFSTYNYLTTTQEQLEAWEEEQASLHTVSGKIMKDNGEPLKHVTVYLRPPEFSNHSVMEESEPFFATTDEEGRFTIGGVPKGNYEMMLGMQFSQINGYTWPVENGDVFTVEEDEYTEVNMQPLMKTYAPSDFEELKGNVTFEWEPVEGAASYELNLGIDTDNYHISSLARPDIQGTTVTLKKDEILGHANGISHSGNGDGGMKLVPESVLGFSNAEADFFWYVNAYDASGNLITSSNGYRLSEDYVGEIPYFQYKEHDLSKADQLLLDDQTEQAIEAYQNAYKENPENIHALRMLTKLTREMEQLTEDEQKDLEMEYFKDLAEKTNDAHALFRLMMHASEEGDWESYFEYAEKYKQVENMNSYTSGMHAIALMKSGEEQQAASLFEEVVVERGEHRFMPVWATLTISMTGDFEQAIELASKYPYIDDESDWKGILERLEKKLEDDPVAKEQFEEGLELYLSGDESSFNQWLEKEAENTVHFFFKQLQRV